MKSVYRYGFDKYTGPQLIKMPRQAKLLSVALREPPHARVPADFDASVWALVDPENELSLRCIFVAETGHEVPEPVASVGKLVGAIHKRLPSGLWYAAHVFDYGIEVKADADREKVLAIMKTGVIPSGN